MTVSTKTEPADLPGMAAPVRVRVWDVATRMFHWLLVGFLGLSWWSARQHRGDLHLLSGTVVLALLLFRVQWGLFGSSTARFRTFLRKPRAVAAYATTLGRTRSAITFGHNPLGGWMVLLLLLVLLAQVTTGLFVVDVDGIESGPLSHLVTFEQGRSASWYHASLFQLLEVLVVVHVAAIVFYLCFKRQNLIGPMFSGNRVATGPAPPLVFVPLLRAVMAAAVAAAVAWYITTHI